MHNPVFALSDTLSFALLDCIILHINGKHFRCSIFTFVQYITYTGITDLKDMNYFVNRCILLINWVSLCPFYQQYYSTVEKNQNYAKIPSNYRKTQQKHQVENFVKNTAAFSTRISKSSRKNNVTRCT